MTHRHVFTYSAQGERAKALDGREDPVTLDGSCGWTNSISHHPRNQGVMIPPTNNYSYVGESNGFPIGSMISHHPASYGFDLVLDVVHLYELAERSFGFLGLSD